VQIVLRLMMYIGGTMDAGRMALRFNAVCFVCVGVLAVLGVLWSLHCESRHQFFGLSGITCMKPGTPKPPCCGGGFVVIVINQIPVPRTIGHLALFVAGRCTVVVKSVAVSGSM